MDKMVENVDNPEDAEINPADSVSNVGSNSTVKSRSSTQSSKTSIMMRAEAKRAALLAHASVMERKHAMEMEAELLRKKLAKRQIEMETEASGAELAVLKAYSDKDGMDFYFERAKGRAELPGERQASALPVEPGHLPAARRENLEERCNGTNTPAQHETIPVTRRQGTGTIVQAINDNSTFQILQKQNEISELLIQQQRVSQLPSREIPVFDDPLKFNLFMHAFKHCVEDKSASKGDCMYYLERYTRGLPRDLVAYI